MMGVNTSIKVNDLWSEPSILWTVVCARRGTGKTAILKQLIPSLLELQCEHERQWHLSRPSSSQGLGSASPPKLICGVTSLEELYKILGKNGGQMLTLEENLENLHKCLLTDKDGSLMQGEELHNLYDAMPKFSSKDGEVSIMTTTCYNHFGMASPSYVMELHHNDRLKLFDRYLISCPDDLSSDENQTDVVPAPSKLPSIKVILQTLYMFHKQPREYVLNPEATQELYRFRDYDIPRVKAQVKQHENSRLVIDKSLGQIVRIAGAIKALTTACDFATQPSGHQYLQWDLTIDKDTVLKAIRLQRYFLEQKMVLLHDVSVFSDHSVLCAPSTSYHHVQSTSQSPVTEPTLASYLESRSPSSTEFPDGFIPDFVSMSLPQFVANYSNKIRRLLEYADDGNGIPASAAAQYSIPPIVHIPGSSNRKPTWVAELFFKKVAELGIGRLCYIKHQTNRKFFLRFRRKRQEQLTDGDRLLLDTLRVNMDLFCRVGNEQLPAEVMSLVDRGLSPFGPMDIHSYERSPHVTCSVEPPVSLSNDTPIKRELEFDEDDAKN